MTIDREKKQYINKKFTTRNFIKTMEHEDIPEVEELLKERNYITSFYKVMNT